MKHLLQSVSVRSKFSCSVCDCTCLLILSLAAKFKLIHILIQTSAIVTKIQRSQCTVIFRLFIHLQEIHFSHEECGRQNYCLKKLSYCTYLACLESKEPINSMLLLSGVLKGWSKVNFRWGLNWCALRCVCQKPQPHIPVWQTATIPLIWRSWLRHTTLLKDCKFHSGFWNKHTSTHTCIKCVYVYQNRQADKQMQHSMKGRVIRSAQINRWTICLY